MNAPRELPLEGAASREEAAGEMHAHLVAARMRADADGVGLLQALQDELASTPEELVFALVALTGLRRLTMAEMEERIPAFTRLPYTECQARGVILFESKQEGGFLAVIADPFNMRRRNWLEERVGAAIDWRIAHASEITAYLQRREQGMRAMDGMIEAATQVENGVAAEDLSLAAISAHTSPVLKLIDSTLYDALGAHASDIHMESGATSMQIKYRLDGVLVPVGAVPGAAMAEQIISRIKVMAELDIAERRVPQDGRFKVKSRGREIDFRVSIMPSVFGEDAVLRVLDKQGLAEAGRITLQNLGFTEGERATIRRLASEPYGMLLVTGPTGSGKTTTLYAAIGEVNDGQHKFITIEDPVEYQLAGVVQIPVNERKGLTFARGLRSILRHDPDRIMVGEIRDTETAQIAVQSALTGHLVFTTVHANSVFDVIGRFLHMGVDPYSFVSALNGVLAQRLIRINCPHCAAPVSVPPEALMRAGLGDGADCEPREGAGCAQCRGTGYRGRKAITEIMALDDELREMVITREPVRKLKEAARARGTRTLREAGLALVRRGETSLAELNRVTLSA